MSLQASLSLAADLPTAVTHETFPTPGTTSVLLGRDLFFDPILSGNRNISCATCHHPSLGSADAVSLGLGEGGLGLGLGRRPDPANIPPRLIPRNAPALFNLGAHEITTLFHDGRVVHDPSTRFGVQMPDGFALERPAPTLLAAQALLPLMSHDEMAGQPGENPVADAVAAGEIRGLHGAWQLLAERVEAIPAYRDRFDAIIGPDEPLHISHIGRALGDFIAYEFRSTDSPFDAYLLGHETALSARQIDGMALFYGKAQCSSCHSGTFQTDQAFHALGLPPLGPGKTRGLYGGEDHGRSYVTGEMADSYRFRTPSLRNVTLTAPYGHNGAYTTLEDMVRHHLAPAEMLARYTPNRARLPRLTRPEADPYRPDPRELARIEAAIDIAPVTLSDPEVDAILDFLNALEDPVMAGGGRLGPPPRVPSGLPLDPAPAPLPAPGTGPDLLAALPATR
ncbi:cytochrome-c peroxidase [Roseovarius sp. C7]|uniref:cytochrome-c peroxidase n=1 Tax=Roseovarius sp. C7 TaxID=3398643 RepID=UPI0039F4B45D